MNGIKGPPALCRRRLACSPDCPVRGLVWDYYADLKVYRARPGQRQAAALRGRFDRIFRRRTGFATLDRPEIPLHTNGAENDIRCQVTRRQAIAIQPDA